MINFEDFKTRVRAQAVEAARSIRNLDDMAASDDYIHTSDLRTPHGQRKEETARKSSLSKVKAVDLLNQATAFSSLVVEDADHEDPDLLVAERQPLREASTPKKPNRFMDDLSERLSKTEDGNDRVRGTDVGHLEMDQLPQLQVQQQPSWNAWLATSPAMANVLIRLQSPTGLVHKDEMRSTVGPLSAQKSQEEMENESIRISEGALEESPHDFVIKSSIAIFGDEERAALDRMRTSSNPGATILNTIMENPHFAFILLTLVLGAAVYFYSRHKEEMNGIR